MRPMTEEDKKMYYWQSQKQWWYIDENGKYVFKPGTPKEVLESFDRWIKN